MLSKQGCKIGDVGVVKKTLTGLLLGIFSFALWAEQGVIVRSSPLWPEPGYGSNPLQTLPPGIEVELLERIGGWQQVKLLSKTGPKGWVRTYQVRMGLEISSRQPLALQTKQDSRGGILSGLSSFSNRLSRQDADDVNRNNVVATIGIRGLSEQDLKSAKANPEALKHMQSYRVDTQQARQFAKSGKLQSQKVEMLPEPAKASKAKHKK